MSSAKEGRFADADLFQSKCNNRLPGRFVQAIRGGSLRELGHHATSKTVDYRFSLGFQAALPNGGQVR